MTEKSVSLPESASITASSSAASAENYQATSALYDIPRAHSEALSSQPDIVVHKSTTATTDVVVVVSIDLSGRGERIKRANDLIERAPPFTIVSSG